MIKEFMCFVAIALLGLDFRTKNAINRGKFPSIVDRLRYSVFYL